MVNELFIMTGVRITEMTEEMSRPYHDKDSHYEVLIKDKSFELINFLLVGNYGSLIIKAKNLKTAMKVFESVKLLFAFCDYIYDEDMALFRMDNNLNNGKDLKNL